MSAPSGSRAAIDDRIARRRRDVRRERQLQRRRRTVRVLVAVVVLAALVAVERSALVGLESVEIVGVERLEVDEVADAADLQLGTSTLRLRLGRVEDRVEALPLVARAEARRLDPLTVRITVDEREPVLRVRAGSDEVVVDRVGVVLGSADDEVAAPERLVTVRTPGPLPAAGEQAADDGALGAAVRVWRGLSGPLRAELAAIRAPSATDLTLDLRSGVVVRIGTPTRLDEKVRALGTVLEDAGDTPITGVDVRAPARPAIIP